MQIHPEQTKDSKDTADTAEKSILKCVRGRFPSVILYFCSADIYAYIAHQNTILVPFSRKGQELKFEN